LERVRDRVNVSKVCATALAKELDMLDTMPVVASGASEDQRVQRLIQRLLRQRESRDRWYLRGKQDGTEWAAERASEGELRKIDEHWSDEEIAECPEMDMLDDVIDRAEYPTFNAQERLAKWVKTDRNDGTAVDDADVDWRTYVLGWYHGSRDLWRSAKPSLGL
jgi:hypothetical protein